MLRLVYTALLYVFAPIALSVTAFRGSRDPAYRERLSERLGFTQLDFTRSASGNSPLWVHAVSVGEVQAAAALVRALLKQYPHRPLLMTTATPTGAQRVRALFGGRVHHAYLPYDLPGAVQRFLDRTRPAIAIVMEREIWPNLFRECARRQVRVVLASARISARSALRHQRLGRLFRDALTGNVIVAAQTPLDADRFRALGASDVHVAGNVKFDLEIAPEAQQAGESLRGSQFPNRLVWVAGSTHEGEESVVLEAHELVRAKRAEALLVLVPRHPNRFEQVRGWLQARKIDFASRSKGEPVKAETSVLLADTLGELLTLYAAADIAFVGGSLVRVGGHNLLEPAALQRPILVGPYNFNGPDIARLLLESGAALEVTTAEQLAAAILALAADPARRASMGANGSAIVAENRGALARVLQLIEPLISTIDG